MWYIEAVPSYSSWSIDLPGGLADHVEHGVVDRGVDDDLGIGPLQGLGPDPAEQGPQRLRMRRVAGELEDLVVLDERVAADRLPLAGDPDDVGVLAADHPAPVVLGADDGPGGVGVLHVVEHHQVVQLDLPPGPDVPEARPSPRSRRRWPGGRFRLRIWPNVCRPQTPQPSGR